MGTHESTVVIRMPDEMKERLQKEAKSLNLSISELIRLKLASLSSNQPKRPVLRINGQSVELDQVIRPDVISYEYASAEKSGIFVWHQEKNSGKKEPSLDFNGAIAAARTCALKLVNDSIGSEHLLLGMIEHGKGNGVAMLRGAGFNLEDLRQAIEDLVRKEGKMLTLGNVPLKREAEKVIKMTEGERRVLEDRYLCSEHLLLAMVREHSVAGEILTESGINYEYLRRMLLQGRGMLG